MTEERRAWDRMEGETTRAYAAFRHYRDLGPLRTLGQCDAFGHVRTIEVWSGKYHWAERVVAWDDECHMADDRARLEAIRTMHDTHQRAGRAVIAKALAALNQLDATDIPAYAAARLLDLGTRLERDTLTISVEELQGIVRRKPDQAEDPWDEIARALSEPDE